MSEGRSVAQMVGGQQHRRPLPIKSQANMATQNMILSAHNIISIIIVYNIYNEINKTRLKLVKFKTKFNTDIKNIFENIAHLKFCNTFFKKINKN